MTLPLKVLSGFSIFIILLRVDMRRVVIFLMNLQNKNVVSLSSFELVYYGTSQSCECLEKLGVKRRALQRDYARSGGLPRRCGLQASKRSRPPERAYAAHTPA
jgi:hypothetical protein